MTTPVNRAGLEWVLVALYRNTTPSSLENFRQEVKTHVLLTNPPPAPELERLIADTYRTMSMAGDCI